MQILGKELAASMGPLWHVREEGEFETNWRQLGSDPKVENLWYMMGNFAWCRFYSKQVALRKFTTALY